MSNKAGGFFHRNAVTIVMVPAIIFIHWGWSKLQDVETLVKKEEKKDLPIVTGFQVLQEKLRSLGAKKESPEE